MIFGNKNQCLTPFVAFLRHAIPPNGMCWLPHRNFAQLSLTTLEQTLPNALKWNCADAIANKMWGDTEVRPAKKRGPCHGPLLPITAVPDNYNMLPKRRYKKRAFVSVTTEWGWVLSPEASVLLSFISCFWQAPSMVYCAPGGAKEN